jgi:hypothetical protein
VGARREYGAPSAQTVLEVAEGLRWTDPALGASLAEHVRRVAGDDPAVRAAADRSLIRSLSEADRHGDVVERGVPLLADARDRGDRDDGAAALIELATAATGLGDPALARRLLDRLGPTSDLPARVGVVACAARAEACAAQGDVAATDAAGDAVAPMLFRVPPPEAGAVRARIALSRGVARRAAGDTTGALATLDAAVRDSDGEGDGSRHALVAVAELTELLVEAGRHDEARERAEGHLPEGRPAAHVAAAVARIRLALSAVSRGGARSATTIAEELEAAGRVGEAARAWERVAGLAETEGDLGTALTALRRGHALDARSRDAGDQALRTLTAVADGPEPLSAGGTPEPEPASPPARRSRRHGAPEQPEQRPVAATPHVHPEPAPAGPLPSPVGSSDGRGPSGDDAAGPPSASVVPAPEIVADERPPAEPVVAPGNGTRSSARDELAEMLASLTRSIDSSRGAAPTRSDTATGDAADAQATDGQRDPGTDPLRSARHSVSAELTAGAAEPVAEPSTTRPTFDAFSTAPARPTADTVAEAPADLLPTPGDRFASTDDGRASLPDVGWGGTEDAGSLSVSDLVDPVAAPEPAVRSEWSWPDPEPRVASERVAVPSDRSGEREPVSSASREDLSTVGREPDRSASRERVDEGPADDGPARVDPGLQAAAEVPSPAPAPPREVTEGAQGAVGESRPSAWDGQSGRDATRAAGNARSLDASEPELGGGRDGSRDHASSEGRTNGTTAPRFERGSSRPGEDAADDRGAPRDTPAPERATAPRSASPRAVDEYDEELALTRASVLAEYHLPDVPMPPRRDHPRPERPAGPPVGDSPTTAVNVPTARRHTSGSLPVPAEQRWASRPEEAAGRPGGGVGSEARNDAASGRGRPPESGAKLADLLAEAMDAFRHVGPEAQDGARGPGVGSRRA